MPAASDTVTTAKRPGRDPYPTPTGVATGIPRPLPLRPCGEFRPLVLCRRRMESLTAGVKSPTGSQTITPSKIDWRRYPVRP